MDQKFSKPRRWPGFFLAGLGVIAAVGFIGYELVRHASDTGNTPRVGQIAPAFTLPDDHGKPVSFAGVLATPLTGSSGPVRSPKAVLIVFYRGYWWASCTSELRGIQGVLGELESAGIRTVAISADTPQESAELARKAGLTFPLLSDGKAEVIRRYDLLDPGAGLGGRDASAPAEFLVDNAGKVRWRSLAETVPAQFLAAVKKLE